VKFLFERNGESALSEQQLELTASMELRWFTPKNAKRLIELAKGLEILSTTEEGSLVLNFEPAEIKIPVGFKPHDDLLEKLEQKHEELSAHKNEAERPSETVKAAAPSSPSPGEIGKAQDDLFMKIIDKIAKAKDLEKTEVISKINKRQREQGFEIEVLALIIANEYGVDIAEFLEDAEQIMVGRVKEQF
jgi:hypothetical protein